MRSSVYMCVPWSKSFNIFFTLVGLAPPLPKESIMLIRGNRCYAGEFSYWWHFSQQRKIFSWYNHGPRTVCLLWDWKAKLLEIGQELPEKWKLAEKWDGSFSSQNEAGCRLGIISLGEKLLVIEACLSAHCQQGNHGPHLKWLTSNLFINLTWALGLFLF